MSPLLWSFLLSAVGIVGMYVAGSGYRAGWLVGLAAQALWITYAIVTRQYGFIIASLCYAAVYARNYALGIRPGQRAES